MLSISILKKMFNFEIELADSFVYMMKFVLIAGAVGPPLGFKSDYSYLSL